MFLGFIDTNLTFLGFIAMNLIFPGFLGNLMFFPGFFGKICSLVFLPRSGLFLGLLLAKTLTPLGFICQYLDFSRKFCQDLIFSRIVFASILVFPRFLASNLFFLGSCQDLDSSLISCRLFDISCISYQVLFFSWSSC